MSTRLRIAIQKSGRLFDKSIGLLEKCGLKFDLRRSHLLAHAKEQPIDLLLVRDDDIPELVAKGVVDLGIVGANVLQEISASGEIDDGEEPVELATLSFGGCRLCLALPSEEDYQGLDWFEGKSIATTYPGLTEAFFAERKIDVRTISLSGAVEIAPRADIADAVCDLVSTGATLEANGLVEVETLLRSKALLLESSKEKAPEIRALIKRLLARVQSVEAAREAKYVMLHIAESKVDAVKAILPGAENPTILNLATAGDKVAFHALSTESVLWETIEELESIGATSILIMPVEKVMG